MKKITMTFEVEVEDGDFTENTLEELFDHLCDWTGNQTGTVYVLTEKVEDV